MSASQPYAATSSRVTVTVPPHAIPRSMVWLLIGSLIALATLPWAIPSLILRIITP